MRSMTKTQKQGALLLGILVMMLPLFVFSLANAGPVQQDDDVPPGNSMPGFTDYGDPVVPVFVDPAALASDVQPNALAEPPVIEVWYGSPQNFGQIGNPQPLLDVLGTVRTSRRITSLTYTVNGGPEQPLSLGPDRRRLQQKGDFHIELEKAALNSGANQVVIKAVDSASEMSEVIVTVNNTTGQVWPANKGVNWSAATEIHDVAQPVDGQWQIENGKLRTVTSAIGYDRMVALGDMGWTNYEVTVPFTAFSIDPEGFKFPSSGPGIGLITRWPGYFQQDDEQPREGWEELGALGWHRWTLNKQGQVVAGLQMIGYSVGYGGVGQQLDTNPDIQIQFGREYTIKMSVQAAGDTDVYRFRLWPSNQAEPTEWHMVGEVGDAGRPDSGSVVLLAHHVDVAFGNVSVRPTSSISPVLNVTTDGNGTVNIDPVKATYDYGDVVTLSAVPQAGNVLARWSGDLDSNVGRRNQIQVALTQEQVDITAHFVTPAYGALTVNANQNQGTVQVSPVEQEYLIGQLVTVKATPKDGFAFDEWIGDQASNKNPFTFVFEGPTEITADFKNKQSFDLNLTTVGEGTIVRFPDKATYFENDVVKLTAEAGPGYRFARWEADLAGFPNPAYVTMTGNKTIVAVFEAVAETFTLNVTATGPGTVQVQPQKAEYLYGELVTLTAVPNSPEYMLGSWGGDLGGNSSPISFGMYGDYTITANFIEAVDPRSDDFNRCSLDNGLWTTTDPVGNSSFSMTGTSLKIGVPAGTAHDLWTNANDAPRALTPAANEDFGIDVKFDTPFETIAANQFQSQGIIVQGSNNRLLRFDFYNDGAAIHAFAATLENGTGAQKSNKIIANGSPLYMRIVRAGDQWTQSYSYNGTSWTQAAKFTYAMTVTDAGVFASNSGKNPAFTAEFDYFFNNAAPIVPQDTNVNTLSVTMTGEGSVTVSPEKESYACGEAVQLTAVPATGWNFIGWEGDLSGGANPATLTISRSHAVTARFSTEAGGAYTTYMPVSIGD